MHFHLCIWYPHVNNCQGIFQAGPFSWNLFKSTYFQKTLKMFSKVTIVYFCNWPFNTTPDTQKEMPLTPLLRVPFPLPTVLKM